MGIDIFFYISIMLYLTNSHLFIIYIDILIVVVK